MSGLAAILTVGGATDVDAAVRRALAAAPHRGSIIEVVTLGSCAIGIVHRPERDPASIALDEHGAVAVAGVIDNLDDLRRSLGDEPIAAEPSPAAVLLALDRRGEPIAERLRGAYVVVASDGRAVRAFRDHLGAGTLFFRDEPERLVVASEAKQVVAAAGLDRRADHDVLELQFYGEEDDGTGTALSGVRRLPKATVLERPADRPTARLRRYWRPEELIESRPVPARDVPEQFDALMGQAVDRALRGDDMLALSGGIDSPTLAAYAAPRHLARFGTALPALSMVFPDFPSADETPFIDAVARRLATPLHAYQPSPADQSLARLDEWVTLMDGPWSGFWHPGMEEDRYRRMAEAGTANLITGDLAEFVMDFRKHLVAHYVRHRRGRPLVRELRWQRRRGASTKSLAGQVAAGVVPTNVFHAWRRRRTRFPTPPWLDGNRMHGMADADRLPADRRWAHTQLAAFEGPGVSMEANQIHQGAFGVQVRRPWGDIDLWEFFLGLRAETKFPGILRKQLVRDLMRGRVPDAVLDRRDKTVLDAFVIAGVDYDSLVRWINTGDFRMAGVDYAVLNRELERRSLGIFEYMWAKDLAAVHAFVSRT